MVHDLLCDSLLSWRDSHRHRATTTLPGLLARLGDATLGDFPRVRPHQFHPWCMFLTQLAAIALHRTGEADPAQSEERWRALLLALTDGHHEPWTLVVDDLSQPAFLQSPVPEGHIEAWATCAVPDDIDVLVTAKNHDVKTSQLDGTCPEYWVYAITTLQTMEGYPGRGYNGISRMNGGYGSRPRVGLTPDPTPSARFHRDVAVLLAQWPTLLDRGYSDRGTGLVWTTPWDGRTSLAMADLSPHFIEICWRLRLVAADDHLCARYTTTSTRRCLNEYDTGDVGDAWIPVERQKGTALTVGRNGFDYRLLTRVLFEGDYAPAATQATSPTDPDPMLFAASAMARGQCKTEGLHERFVPLPKPIRFKLGVPAERASLAARATARVAAAALMHEKVLRRALGRLRGGVPGDEYDAQVDEVFFEDLFATADEDDDHARLMFEQRLRDIAWTELQAAITRSGLSGTHQLRDISEAERVFRACMAKHFPDLMTSTLTSPSGGEA